MEVKIELDGLQKLEKKLDRLNHIRHDAVIKKNTEEMLNRARQPGGTPVDTGELRASSVAYPSEGIMGYTAEYAPHVEYGHRTQDGGYVEGQHFLQKNADTQKEILRQDYLKAIEKEIKG